MTTSNVSNVFNENIKIKRALISVTEKSNRHQAANAPPHSVLQ